MFYLQEWLEINNPLNFIQNGILGLKMQMEQSENCKETLDAPFRIIEDRGDQGCKDCEKP